ncbi:hypothetical protein B0H10DRAFT_1939986 [Mycena sp. CBHHK59/15]|nr:hypothetical protein B0H10DRAFT_1939986 [Mycena sp. CBHHK59/15]
MPGHTILFLDDKEKENIAVRQQEEDVQQKIDALQESLQNSTPKVPSLADLALKPAMEHSIQTGDTKEVEELVWLLGKAGLMKSVLCTQNPFPDTGLSLFKKIIQHEAVSDKTTLEAFNQETGPNFLVELKSVKLMGTLPGDVTAQLLNDRQDFMLACAAVGLFAGKKFVWITHVLGSVNGKNLCMPMGFFSDKIGGYSSMEYGESSKDKAPSAKHARSASLAESNDASAPQKK